MQQQLPEWREVETPTTNNLFSVVSTVDGPYAIGGGGQVLAKRDGEWEIVIEDGPNVRSNRLMGLDVTDDGKRIWFAGNSGALGCYDVQDQRKFDYSYPRQKTSTWEAICVSGDAGSEKGLVANGSGEVMPFLMDGHDVNWGVVQKPAHKGATITALAASPSGVAFAVDTNGNAFRTTEEGWEDIGIVNAQVKFYDIYAGKDNRVFVAAGGGRVYRYDDSYRDWTPVAVGEDAGYRAIATEKEDKKRKMVVVGSGGHIYERTGEKDWDSIWTPTSSMLNDVTLGKVDVAVGRSGTILERPDKARQAGKSADGDNYEGRGENYDGDGNPRQDSTTDQQDGKDQSYYD